jgi:hypothetical protein
MGTSKKDAIGHTKTWGESPFFGGAIMDLRRRFVQNIQITAFFRRSFVQYAENKKS